MLVDDVDDDAFVDDVDDDDANDNADDDHDYGDDVDREFAGSCAGTATTGSSSKG